VEVDVREHSRLAPTVRGGKDVDRGDRVLDVLKLRVVQRAVQEGAGEVLVILPAARERREKVVASGHQPPYLR
jgi:hypothetical protein